MKKIIYTTTEYINALEANGNTMMCRGMNFAFFKSKAEAEGDAQWLADYHKREGIKGKKPRVLRVTFEVVKNK